MTEGLPYGLHVMGEHWLPDLCDLSELGRLVTLAKDHEDGAAADRLCRLLGEFALTRHPLVRDPWRWSNAAPVVAVPPNPVVRDHLSVRLAEAVASALGRQIDHYLIVRHHPTVRLRDTEPSRRRATVALAGYEVTRSLQGATVILVDDVIMTGTTIGFIAELLAGAGAARVEVVVASRTRRHCG